MIPATVDDLIQEIPFSLRQADKDKILLPLLKELTTHHCEACPAYKKMVDLAFPQAENAQTLADIPYLPIGLFKNRRIRSIPVEDVRVTVKSSGTTGSHQSQIDLDAETAKLTSVALGSIISHITEGRRLPMLVIDSTAALASKGSMGARAAAILGLMPFGRDHCFVLHEDLSLDETKLNAFLEKHVGQDILIYGFTFLIWQYFIPALEKHTYDLSKATLLHSGGWKRLANIAVDNQAYKAKLKQIANVGRVMNFYGMAETPGTIFLENQDGLLYPPHFADVIIRDPVTFEALPQGKPGLIQILTPLPHSYPGHSLLTEDIGVIEDIDNGVDGRFGKGLRIIGRAPKAEMRGCSDVLSVPTVKS